MNCLSSECNRAPLFKALKTSEVDDIIENCNLIKFNKGEMIFKQGTPANHVLYIRNGLVKVSNKCSNNSELIVQLVKSYNFIGLSSLLCGDTYNCSSITIEPSEICYIQSEVFFKLIEHNSSFAKDIIQYISKSETLLVKRLYNIIHKQVPGRISDLLIYFSKDIYNSNQFEFPLSRNELASFIGISKKSFIITLGEFNNDRLINLDGKKIEILRMDLIERLSLIG